VARIIGVADTFDAMTTNRPYQEAKTLDFVLSKLRAMSGHRFDPRVVDALLAAVAAGDVTHRPHPADPMPKRRFHDALDCCSVLLTVIAAQGCASTASTASTRALTMLPPVRPRHRSSPR